MEQDRPNKVSPLIRDFWKRRANIPLEDFQQARKSYCLTPADKALMTRAIKFKTLNWREYYKTTPAQDSARRYGQILGTVIGTRLVLAQHKNFLFEELRTGTRQIVEYDCINRAQIELYTAIKALHGTEIALRERLAWLKKQKQKKRQ